MWFGILFCVLIAQTLRGISIASATLSIELNDPMESIALSSKLTSLLNLYFLLNLYEVS